MLTFQSRLFNKKNPQYTTKYIEDLFLTIQGLYEICEVKTKITWDPKCS
jgi:hypothetical protein